MRAGVSGVGTPGPTFLIPSGPFFALESVSPFTPVVYLLTSKRANKGSSRIDFANFVEETEHHLTIFCTLI